MSNQFVTNTTVHQYQSLLERVLLSTLTTVPCCVFLFINGTMLFILRSKSVFCETSRYILLYNLLFSETVMLILSQSMYIVAACRVRLTYPVCGLLTMVSNLTKEVSPLTLVMMSLERYVAVCYPLRQAAIVTIRNTMYAVFTVWAISSLNVLIRVILLLRFPFEDLPSLQMKHLCSERVMLLSPMLHLYDKAYTCFVFVTAGVAIISSYVGVTIAAKSASSDQASTQKIRNTLLLHLIQLGLSLCSTIQSPLLIATSAIVTRIAIVRIQIVFYMCMFIFPRCLSPLIYGIRDQNIRPILIYHLCCRQK
ncbi:odorant receptor 131-2-like [Halichoeres trimaculatus]|uniref:odorant receptor 131-2-like n=1 Tax=Halichoeres trimaculatus TaxID=147232 RepID=UPI003D9DE921